MSSPIDKAKQKARDVSPSETPNEVIDAFVDATVLCCGRFLDDHSHTAKSPLVNGPCDTCIQDTVDRVRQDEHG